MSRKNSFIVYTSYYKQISKLTDEQRGKLFTAMMEYAISGNTSAVKAVKMDNVTEMAFDFISDQMSRDAEAYADKCATNKENGSKGGRPRKPSIPDGLPDDAEKPNGFSDNHSEPDGLSENPYDNEDDGDDESDADNDAGNDVGNNDMSEGKASDSSPTIIELTLNDKSLYPITERQANEYAELYPAVNIMQELRAMKAWLISNPQQRKTKRGILRFVNAWLARAQDRGGPRTNGGANNDFKPSKGFRRVADGE